MPIPVHFEKKSIKHYDDTFEVLEIIKAISESLEAKSNIDAAVKPVAKETEDNILSKLKKLLSLATGKLPGTDSSVIPDLEIFLDSGPYKLFMLYMHYLTKLINATRANAAQKASNDGISDRFILIREILLRTVALSLSTKPDDIDHGEKTIKFIVAFINAINKKGILLHTSILNNGKISVMGIGLMTNHNPWIDLVSKMTQAIKQMHLPKIYISSVLTELTRLQSDIIRYILILANPDNIKDGDLTEGFIFTTLAQFEEKYAPMDNDSNELSALQTTNILQLNDSCFATEKTETQTVILTTLDKKKHPETKKIDSLYALLHKTNLLFTAAGQVEFLINAGGWILILCNILNLVNLGKLVERHCKSVRDYLDKAISPDDFFKNKKHPAYIQLMGTRRISTEVFPSLSIVAQAELLESSAVKQLVFDNILDNLRQLNSTQNAIRFLGDKDYPLINENHLNFPVLIPSQSQLLTSSSSSSTCRHNSSSSTSSSASSAFDTGKMLIEMGGQSQSTSRANDLKNSENGSEKKLTLYDYKESVRTRRLTENKKMINCLLATPDGMLICGLTDTNIAEAILNSYLPIVSEKYLQVWNIINNTCKELINLRGANCKINALGLLQNGHVLITSFLGNVVLGIRTLYIWNRSGEEERIDVKISISNLMAVFSDGAVLLATGAIAKIELWNLKFDRPSTAFDDSEALEALEVVSKDFFAGSRGNKIWIWDKNHTKCLRILKGHTETIKTLKKISDNLLASGSKDKTIKIWDVSSGNIIQTLTGHTDSISSLTLLTEKYLASGSCDGTIRIWDYRQGTCVQTISQHKGEVSALTTLDGKLISGGYDGCIYIHTFAELKLETQQQETQKNTATRSSSSQSSSSSSTIAPGTTTLIKDEDATGSQVVLKNPGSR